MDKPILGPSSNVIYFCEASRKHGPSEVFVKKVYRNFLKRSSCSFSGINRLDIHGPPKKVVGFCNMIIQEAVFFLCAGSKSVSNFFLKSSRYNSSETVGLGSGE